MQQEVLIAPCKTSLPHGYVAVAIALGVLRFANLVSHRSSTHSGLFLGIIGPVTGT